MPSPGRRTRWVHPVKPSEGVAWPDTGSRSFAAIRRTSKGKQRIHKGVDLFAPKGTAVVAVDDGVVTHASESYQPGFAGFGAVVALALDDGPHVLYSHLDQVLVRPGQRVEAGEQLGTIGTTAFTRRDKRAHFKTSKPHLHFEVSPRRYPLRRDAPRLDPSVFYVDQPWASERLKQDARKVRVVNGKRIATAKPVKSSSGWSVLLGIGMVLFVPLALGKGGERW